MLSQRRRAVRMLLGLHQEMRKPKVNLPATGRDDREKRCIMCARPRRRSSKFCGRCSRTDITKFLDRRLSLTYCPGCSCYLQPPSKYVRPDQLLSLCVRLIRKLFTRPLRIPNAEFIESSDDDVIRVKLHLRGEISQGAISERIHLAEFTVRHKICNSCSRSSISDPQQCVTRVELRQRHPQVRRTLSCLERTMSKYGATRKAVRIQENDWGTDFMFSDRAHALDFVQFIECVRPVKKRSDDDGVSATFFTLHIRRYDLIRLPTTISVSLLGEGGNLDPLVICTKVSAHGISLMDPFTLQATFLTADDYCRVPFRMMLDSSLSVEYLVLDIIMITPDPPPSKDVNGNSYHLVNAHIVRVSDLGKGDGHNKLMVRTHLGHLLKPGDYVRGYDVGGAGGPAMEVILVKKCYQVTKNRRRKCIEEPSSREPRSVGTGLDAISKDEYEELLRELEENTRLGLINSSSHQISEEAQMLPTSSDDVPSNPEGEWLGDEAAADNTTMEWLPSAHISREVASGLSDRIKRFGE